MCGLASCGEGSFCGFWTAGDENGGGEDEKVGTFSSRSRWVQSSGGGEGDGME
jgi:hypothetical protein